MIRGVHGLFYSAAPEATRAFLRDQLRLPYTDVGEGWLIFDLPEADLGVHPIAAGDPGEGSHDVSFYCDDIDATVAELRSRGVELEPIEPRSYGRVTHLTMPGGVRVQLYEPRYTKKTAARPGRRPRATSKTRKTKTKVVKTARRVSKQPARRKVRPRRK
jgi:catechol 2,3-dioxygenase-like lactoylglutathione lyase family enzyme